MGEVCDRHLKTNCGHFCLFLCHPGPYPSCPKLVKAKCFCGKIEDVKRCGFKLFSCNNVCNRSLDCMIHKCKETCHDGDCPPCRARGVYRCYCGGKEERKCFEWEVRCKNKCERFLGCGKHVCERGCHSGKCGQCPLQGKRTCPCGKRVYEGMACDKVLSCCLHRCHERCHRRQCIETCRLAVTKSCRCGGFKKEVPCGTEMDQKPPRCRKLCHILSFFWHASYSKPHKCHYGACPPCQLFCEEEYPCGHKCNLRFHGPRPPPNPEFTLKPKKKKTSLQSEGTPGSACPPCPELVWRSCVGQHLGAERMMVCSDRTLFSCDNLCGNPLPCGNHYCPKTCHALKNQSTKSSIQYNSESPVECHLPCEKKRQPACPHNCPPPCHPGECPPCMVLVKRACHWIYGQCF